MQKYQERQWAGWGALLPPWLKPNSFKMPWDKIRKTSRQARSADCSSGSQARPWGGAAGGDLEGWNKKETFAENTLAEHHHGKSNRTMGLAATPQEEHPPKKLKTTALNRTLPAAMTKKCITLDHF